ncbi:MAG: hypothetical protein KIT54_02585, partial [Phycisphaeraceae bacterium]|nr:hypothetical protein [Phycisphaeraceae bacterium]
AAVIISDAGVQRERAFYSPYGRVFGMPAGDLNFDGEFTSAEATTISGWSAAYRAYADINLDGVIDGDDATANTPGTLGWNALSRDGSTIGYAGYVQDSSIPTLSHVRHRVYKSDLGRWVQRDPAGYVDGANLYEYARSSPVTYVDWSGLASQRGGCGLGGVGVDLCGGIGSRGIIGSFIPVPRIPIPGITVPWVFKCSRDWNKCWEKCKDGSLGKSWCEDGEWQCCICDPYIKQQYSSATEYIAECVDAHETCHTLQECPPEGGYTQKQAACLEVPCYDVEIKCLEVREKLCETESCRKSIKEALEDAKRLRADYQAKCLGL